MQGKACLSLKWASVRQGTSHPCFALAYGGENMHEDCIVALGSVLYDAVSDSVVRVTALSQAFPERKQSEQIHQFCFVGRI
jgi:hypothetical protein